MFFYIKRYLPGFIKNRLYRLRSLSRINKIKENDLTISISDFEIVMSKLGLVKNDNVFIHSSGNWLAGFEGGLMGLIDIIKTIVGPEGNILMPGFTMKGYMIDAIKENNFNVSKTPSQMGILTEIFRRMPDVQRSLHPTHSVLAQGPNANYFLADHHKSSHPFGESSPFYRMQNSCGKILLMGVDLTVLTHVHVVEDVKKDFPVKPYLPKKYACDMTDYSNHKVSFQTFVHNPAISARKNILKIKKGLIDNKIMKTHKISDVEFFLIDAKGLFDYLSSQAERGVTIYDH